MLLNFFPNQLLAILPWKTDNTEPISVTTGRIILSKMDKPYTEEKCMEIVRGTVAPKVRKPSEDITVRDGKYGPYFSFKGKNYKVKSYAESMKNVWHL